MLARLAATRYDRPATSGRTRPVFAAGTADDGTEIEVVLKASGGCDRGVQALACEMLAACLAADLGLPVPEPFLVGVGPEWISQQVKRLEGDAGCALFRRGRRGVSLTPQCEAVLSYARAVAALTDELRHHLGEAGSTSKIGIGLAEDFCRTALPSILARFGEGHPHIDLRIISGDYALLARSLAAKEIRKAFGERMQKSGAVPFKGTGGVRMYRGIRLRPHARLESADAA